MFAFPMMIAEDAKMSGMRVPESDQFSSNDYPHFSVLCWFSIGRPINWTHARKWVRHNAKIIADIPEEKARKMCMSEFVDAGVIESCF